MSKKVFISSTCYDLIDIRAELKKALEEWGFYPILSDDPKSGFDVTLETNSIETCLVNLRSSDIVILVLSQRYGTSLKNSGFEDYSATHLEYLEAKKEGKTILFFVRDRLDADYNSWKKHGKKDPNYTYSWVKSSDIRLFDIISDRALLTSENTSNWIVPFTSSIDLKESIKKQLQKEIGIAVISNLIKSGRCPLITIDNLSWSIKNQHSMDSYYRVNFRFKLRNVGNSVAINPIFLADTDGDKTPSSTSFRRTSIPSNDLVEYEQDVTIPKDATSIAIFIIAKYDTIEGYSLSDLSIIKINSLERNGVFISSYERKKYYGSSSFEITADAI